MNNIAEIRGRHIVREHELQAMQAQAFPLLLQTDKAHADRATLLTHLAELERERERDAAKRHIEIHAGDTLSLDNEVQAVRRELRELEDVYDSVRQDRDAKVAEAGRLRAMLVEIVRAGTRTSISLPSGNICTTLSSEAKIALRALEQSDGPR